MDLLLSEQQREFARSLRAYLDGLDLTEVYAERRIGTAEISEAGPAAQRLLKRMAGDGWLGVGWPAEYGGLGRAAVDQWIFIEEMTSRGLPTGGLTLMSVGPTIMRVGTPEQKDRYLPPIIAGESVFAIGYSEPNSGTDLASLQTRAVREGDEYVVNGQKIYTTGAHYATHIWLATRTGTTADRSRGISVLIVPLDSPGVLVRPLHTQSDGRTNEVFFENVRVPAANLVGRENGGWDVIKMALDFERIMPYSSLWKDFRRLLDWAGSTRRGDALVIDDPEVRRTLAGLAAEIEIARLLCVRTAAQIDAGQVPRGESSMTKVFYSELQQRLHVTALDIVGAEGLIGVDEPDGPAGGVFERLFRSSTMLRFGAGNNEIQREIIATQHLGLPRAPVRITAKG